VSRPPGQSRLLPAVLLAVLPALSACVGPTPAAPGPGPEAGGSPPWAQAYLAQGGDAFVPDPARPLVWLGVISQELPYDGAVWYCRRLPPHGPAEWRVPTVAELQGAPFARYALPDTPVRLWSADVAAGEAYARWVVDPRTGVPEVKTVGPDLRLRVLCVTDGGDAPPRPPGR
jgi:hypothetical protein